MTINANVFSSAGRRSLLSVSLADGATVQQALEAAGEGVPPNCDIFMNGEAVSQATPLPMNAGVVTITVNQKTKGNWIQRAIAWLGFTLN